MDEYKTFGQLMREARLKCGITKTELSFVTGISRASLKTWEQDDNWPSLDKALVLSRKLNFSLDQVSLFPEKAKAPKPEAKKPLERKKKSDDILLTLPPGLGNISLENE